MSTSYLLRLKDNRSFSPVLADLWPAPDSPGAADALVRLLQRYAGRTPDEFRTGGTDGFHDNAVWAREDGKNSVFEIHGSTLDGLSLTTGNTMGVLRLRQGSDLRLTLEIGSRFDTAENQFFLNYLLHRAFTGSLVDAVQISHSSLWDLLLMLVFRNRLAEAFNQGLFKRYTRYEHNDARFRGSVNLNRHLHRNVPFHGAIAYTTHEFSHDTPVARLVRSALWHIENKFPGLLDDREGIVTEARRAIERSTPSWRAGNLAATLKENRAPIRHAYFTAYEPLRRVSLAVLADEGAALYDEPSTDEVEGVIFDGAWLWEKYLATLLVPLGFKHYRFADGEGMRVFMEGSYELFPDFHHPTKNFVLDAKYKWLGRREDLHQVLAYMFLTGATRGGIILPSDEAVGNVRPQRLAITVGTSAKKSFWTENSVAWWHQIVLRKPSGVLSAQEFISGMVAAERDILGQVREGFEPVKPAA